MHFDPAGNYFKKLLNQEKFENYSEVYIKCRSFLPNWRPNIDYKSSVSAKAELGGGVLLELSHEIDLANLLCGTAELKYVKSIDNENFKKVDFESTLFFKNKNGFEYKVSMNYLSKELIRRGSISTKNAKYDFDLVNNSFSERSESGEKKIYYTLIEIHYSLIL